MSVFPDTSFLCSLYRRQDNSPQAIAYLEKHAARFPFPVFCCWSFANRYACKRGCTLMIARTALPERRGK
jgi:hypothetical protein